MKCSGVEKLKGDGFAVPRWGSSLIDPGGRFFSVNVFGYSLHVFVDFLCLCLVLQQRFSMQGV